MEGDNVNVATLQAFYRRLNDLIGTEAMLLVWNEFKGTQLTIPLHLYDRNLAGAQVKKLYNGENARALASQFGYSEKWVRKEIKKGSKGS